MSTFRPFVVLEGGEGSGKDTMIDRLKARYAANDDVIFTQSPGYTALGKELRRLLLSPDAPPRTVRAELLMFLADRAQLFEEVVLPALKSGKAAIGNRLEMSTVAYQVYGRDRMGYLDFVLRLGKQLTFVRPFYLVLDVPPEIGLARVEQRGDGKTSFDAESLAFHERVRQGYLRHLNTVEGFDGELIDATRPLEEVWQAVKAKVEELIGPPSQ